MSSSIESVSNERRSFPPSAEFVAKANVSGRAAYDAMCAEAERDYAGFWAAQARSNPMVASTFTRKVRSGLALHSGMKWMAAR